MYFKNTKNRVEKMISNKIYLLHFIMLYFLPNLLIGQRAITSIVVNATTNQPLVYANIALEGTSIGTITNEDGYFKLKLKKSRHRNLVIGFIGFEQKIFVSADIIPDTIYLHPKTHLLDAISVVADGNVLNILTKAYRNIEKNYPQKTTKLIGYYREITKDSFDNYLNLSEGILDFVKSKYNKGYKGDRGQVKINKARTYFFPETDTISKLDFIATHFVAGNTDFVKKRSEFINPKFFDRYKFSLTSILMDGEREIYEIHFSTENGKLKGIAEGRLLIDSETYAYKEADIQLNEKGIRKRNALRFPGTPYKSLAVSHKIRFQKLNDKWHLKHAAFKGKGFDKSTKTTLLFLDDFAVNEVVIEGVKAIPLAERISFGEVFIRQENNDFDFFKEYSILEKEESLESQLKLITKDLEKEENSDRLKKEYKKKQSKQKLYQLMSKIELGYEAGYFPISMQAQILQINGWGEGNSPIEIERKLLGFSNIISRYSYMGFRLNKRWGVNIGTHKNYGAKKRFRGNEIGINYTLELKKIGRPLLLRSGVYLSSSTLEIPFQATELAAENDKWRIDDDIFSIKNIELGYLNYFIKIQPSLNFSYSIRNRVWLNLGVDFTLPLHEKGSLTINNNEDSNQTIVSPIKEKKFDFSNDSFSIKSNNETLKRLPIENGKPSFRLGIRFHL